MVTAVFIFSLGIPTGTIIKMLSNTDYHRNPYIIWRCLFPKTCITSENSHLPRQKPMIFSLMSLQNFIFIYYWKKDFNQK